MARTASQPRNDTSRKRALTHSAKITRAQPEAVMLSPAARKSSCVSTALPAETMAMNHHLWLY